MGRTDVILTPLRQWIVAYDIEDKEVARAELIPVKDKPLWARTDQTVTIPIGSRLMIETNREEDFNL